MRNHLLAQHKFEYDALLEKKKRADAAAIARGDTVMDALTNTARNSMPMSTSNRDIADRLFALWVAKTCQPMSVFEQDTLRECLDFLTAGRYQAPSHQRLHAVSCPYAKYCVFPEIPCVLTCSKYSCLTLMFTLQIRMHFIVEFTVLFTVYFTPERMLLTCSHVYHACR